MYAYKCCNKWRYFYEQIKAKSLVSDVKLLLYFLKIISILIALTTLYVGLLKDDWNVKYRNC